MQPDAGIVEEPRLWSGPCWGGPLDTQEMVSRYPMGFLLVDRPAGRCWLYDWKDPGFLVRVADGYPLENDPDAPKNRFRAADEAEYDVVAAPWIGGDDDGDDGTPATPGIG